MGEFEDEKKQMKVPVGKCKGQPVEVLAQDPDWLL